MSNNRYDISLNQAMSSKNNPKLLYVSSSRYEGDWPSILHTHYCAELFFVIDGFGQFQIEDQIYSVSTDDLIMVNPNVLHTEISVNSSPLTYIVLGVEGFEIEDSSNFYIENFTKNKEAMLFYLKQLIEENENKSPGYEFICQNLIEILVCQLGRTISISSPIVTHTKKPSRISALSKRFIDKHYKEDLSLDILAEAIHISKYHIVHAFTEEYGISPMKYLISKRIQESCKLLQTTDYSLTHISRMLGFSSPSYFSQAFKKEQHCSPLEYRKKHRSSPTSY